MKAFFYVILLFCSSIIFSQTGPAGVGNSSNNCFWIKADAGTSSTVNAAAVATWSDQSGNGNHVTQSTAVRQPLFATSVINGFPAVQFDNTTGTNDKLIGPDSPLMDNTSGLTFFMVSRPQVLDGEARVIVSKRTTVAVDQSFMQFYYTGNTFQTDIQSNNNRYATAATFAANNNYLIDQLYDGTLAAASRCRTFVSGSLNVTATESSTLVPDNPSPVIIGSTDASDNRPFGGYISEVIIYRKACNDPERIIVDNYLSAKYNINLTVNDKYLGDNAGNGNYDYEVAGIGTDATGSSSSFSPSVSGGLGITATGTGFNSGDYVLAGHATFTNAQIFTDVGGMTGVNNARWARIWYVDLTNTGINIQTNITFDMSDGGVGATVPGPAANYVLLYRPAQTGNWTEVAVASSTLGDQVLFNAYSFTDDGYYTIGTKNANVSPLPVQLINFNAKYVKEHVDLEWSTASEKDADYFTVERSADGKDFVSLFTVKAFGSAVSVRNYKGTDPSPLPNTSYYRLMITDLSGEYSYSKIAAVSKNENDVEECFLVYPNPTEGQIQIDLKQFMNERVQIRLVDESGRICMIKSVRVPEENPLVILEPEMTLQAGTYIVIVSSDQNYCAKKLRFK